MQVGKVDEGAVQKLVRVHQVNHSGALCSKLLGGDANVDALFKA